MTGWGSIRSIPIGGLVVVGFLDERRIVVGSHSGLGVFDAREGTRLDRVADLDDDYAWFREAPPVAAYTDRHGEHLVEVAGLWGGTLPTSRTTAGPAEA